MLFVFQLFVLLECAENKVVQLTDKTFEAEVLKHKPNEVWFVMFMTDDDNQTVKAMNMFKNASIKADGLVKFGVLNIRRAPKPVQMYEIRNFPSFRIFYQDKNVAYTGPLKVSYLIKNGVKHIPDLSENVTESWKDEFFSHPAAIYFTRKNKTTPLWNGISAHFYKSHVKIGTCRNESLFKLFGVEKTPAVVFFNGTNRQEYNGAVKFENLSAAISKFFAKRFEQHAEADSNEIFLPDQFMDYCIGSNHLCVLSISSSLPNEFSLLRKENKRHKMLFFAGVKNLPFKFMSSGYWIYHPRKDSFIHIDNSTDLLPTIDRIFDGSAKWVKRIALENNQEL